MMFNRSVFWLLSLFFIAWESSASVILMQDRLIFSPGEKSANLQVQGDTTRTFLLQSWVSDTSDQEVPSLTVSPPLVVVPPQKSQFIRVLYQGAGLPEDRESRVWLNIQAIAAQADDAAGQNTLTPSYIQTISLFYRPKALSNQDANAAALNLEWSINKKGANQFELTAKNPTPFNILISGAFIADRADTTSQIFGVTSEPPGYIKPFESITFSIFRIDNTPFKDAINRREFWFTTKNDAGFSIAYYATMTDSSLGKFSLFVPPPKVISPDDPNKESPAGNTPDPVDSLIKPTSPRPAPGGIAPMQIGMTPIRQ